MRRAALAIAFLGAYALLGYAQSIGDRTLPTDQTPLRGGQGAGAFVPAGRLASEPAGDERAVGPATSPAETKDVAGAAAAAPEPSPPRNGPFTPPPVTPRVASPAPASPAVASAPAAVPPVVRQPAVPVALAPPPPAAEPPKEELIAAKVLFGGLATPAPMRARAIGFYSKGCLAGAVPVPIDGETWQVMRLSRNRNWGHPKLVALIERLAEDVAAKDGWQGLLVGDVSQPRGGPMVSSHASHQIGLDVDIWLSPMPDHRLTAYERDHIGATSMLGRDKVHVDPEIFTQYHAAIIRRAASYPEVERIFVNPGIKKAMCLEAGVDHKDFHKIRPYWGHDEHFHIRIGCPADSAGCKPQPVAAGDDGCGHEVDEWIRTMERRQKPDVTPPAQPPTQPQVVQTPSKKHVVTLADLPSECRAVVDAPESDPATGQAMVPTKAAHSQR